MDSLRNEHETKTEPNVSTRKTPQSPLQSRGTGPTGSVQHRWQDLGHICTHHCWQSEWLHRGHCRWKDSGMGGCARARCGWQEPATKPHCEAPLLKAQGQAALLTHISHTRRAEGSVSAKVAIPPEGSAHLSLGKQNHVQKSMFSKVITQSVPF